MLFKVFYHPIHKKLSKSTKDRCPKQLQTEQWMIDHKHTKGVQPYRHQHNNKHSNRCPLINNLHHLRRLRLVLGLYLCLQVRKEPLNHHPNGQSNNPDQIRFHLTCLRLRIRELKQQNATSNNRSHHNFLPAQLQTIINNPGTKNPHQHYRKHVAWLKHHHHRKTGVHNRNHR